MDSPQHMEVQREFVHIESASRDGAAQALGLTV